MERALTHSLWDSGVREEKDNCLFSNPIPVENPLSIVAVQAVCVRVCVHMCNGIFLLAWRHGIVFHSQISSNNHFHHQSCHMLPLTKLKLLLLTQVTFNKENSMDGAHTVLNAGLTSKPISNLTQTVCMCMNHTHEHGPIFQRTLLH